MEALNRWKELELLQEHYSEFTDFCYDVIHDLMGFTCTDIQLDIGNYLQYGPQNLMVQAQRSQAKTTITAAFAVWCLIHDPSTRVVIFSGGGDMADEISGWIVQIVRFMPGLECLRPDERAGDRNSTKRFDVHYSLKGPEKSPSVSSRGVFSQMQGKRADLLIADDVETKENSETENGRAKLLERTKDFTSICQNGRIIYLGTRQSTDSIYNSLPDRGYDLRIWPGRYPTAKELPNYGPHLAPLIRMRIEQDPSLQMGGGPTGERGKPVDPILLDEDALTSKEIDQGAAYFQLQHMLDTRLMDADRYPLKRGKLIVTRFDVKSLPMLWHFAPSVQSIVSMPTGHPIKEPLYRPSDHEREYCTPTGTYMYVDPAGGGQNGDEMAWAITSFANGYIYGRGIGGLMGGITMQNMHELTRIAKKYGVTTVGIEKNFGNGTLANIWQPMLLKDHKCTIEEVWESGQKELRIIDILEPLLADNRIVLHEDVISDDWVSVQVYPPEVRKSYCFLHQLAKITRSRGALLHDDRVDAFAGACRPWVKLLRMDREKQAEKTRAERYKKLMMNPLGNGRAVPGYKTHNKQSTVRHRLAFKRR